MRRRGEDENDQQCGANEERHAAGPGAEAIVIDSGSTPHWVSPATAVTASQSHCRDRTSLSNWTNSKNHASLIRVGIKRSRSLHVFYFVRRLARVNSFDRSRAASLTRHHR